MRGLSLRKKTIWMIGACLVVMVVFSTLISYVFYSDAVTSHVSADKKQFFIIFTCAEFLVMIVLVLLGTVYVDLCIVRPVKAMTEAVASIRYEDGDGEERLGLKNLDIRSGDELEELYHALQQFQLETGEYIATLHQENWSEEHDSMTMLDNREKFERRAKEVYPLTERLYIACINIVNLHVVNERLGVDAGDSILSKVARELRRLAGEEIHAYRLEEDHFVLVFVGYTEEDARSVMENWVERVGRLNRGSDQFECRLVWGGAYGEDKIDVMDVYRHADTELYCNKVVMKRELEV